MINYLQIAENVRNCTELSEYDKWVITDLLTKKDENRMIILDMPIDSEVFTVRINHNPCHPDDDYATIKKVKYTEEMIGAQVFSSYAMAKNHITNNYPYINRIEYK